MSQLWLSKPLSKNYEKVLKKFKSEWIQVNAGSVGELTFTVALPESFQLEEDSVV